jgi:hypothetical protein
MGKVMAAVLRIAYCVLRKRVRIAGSSAPWLVRIQYAIRNTQYATLVAALLCLGTACDVGGQPGSPPTSHGGPVRDQPSLIDALRAAGHTSNPTGFAQQPFLSGSGNTVQVDGETIQVFEYPDEAAARGDAAKIPADANIPGVSVSWPAQPHFYQTGRIIVIYAGTDAKLLASLESTLGKPFAVGP